MSNKRSALHRFAIVILSILLIILMVFASYLFIINSPARKIAQEDQIFEVAKGQSANTIIQQLNSQGYIKNAFFLRLYYRLKPQAIRAGSYKIPAGLTAIQTLNYLVKTAPQEGNFMSITIPEGLSIREAAAIWQSLGLFDASDFLDAAMDRQLLDSFKIEAESFEGWLFPDTYLVQEHITARQTVELMANQFFKVLNEVAPHWQTLPFDELNKYIIVASLVQKEHKVPQDAPLIAAVIYNRLNKNMLLQIDSTINYARKERHAGDHLQRILFSDLTLDDPYNTYQHVGLPPGPIGLSGRVALQGAFFPDKNDYLFFVVIPNSGGRHHFSKTFDEHRQHAAIYRNWIAQNTR